MGALDNKTILFSGVFEGHERADLEAQAEAAGAKLLSGVSKNLNYLVAGEKMGPQKKDKADELGIPIITLDDFFAMLPGGGTASSGSKKPKLPKVLPQTGEEALKFIASLKLANFKIEKKGARLIKDEYPKEFNDTINLISSVQYDYRSYSLSVGLMEYFSELHDEMLGELDDDERKKMKNTSFVYKSKEEAFFPLEDYRKKVLTLGQDGSGDALICLTELRSIYDSVPVALVSHSACESYVTIEANSLAEYWCRCALEQWGNENNQEDEISDYIYGFKRGLSKK